MKPETRGGGIGAMPSLPGYACRAADRSNDAAMRAVAAWIATVSAIGSA